MSIHRRGACPGLSSPMPTGDGLLVRIVPVDRFDPDALVALCSASLRHGNGLLEITARGSLQIRGLTEQSAPSFAAAVTELPLAQRCTIPVLSDFLLDDPTAIIDSGALASELRYLIEAAGLAPAPKVSVLIDGGGQLRFDATSADVRLLACIIENASRLLVMLGGDRPSARLLGVIRPEHAAEVAVRLLGVIAAHGRTARAIDVLHEHGLAPFRAVVADAIEDPPVLPTPQARASIGDYDLGEERIALGISPAFGLIEADALAAIARIAAENGARAMRTAPHRTLVLCSFARTHKAVITDAAGRLGFVVRPDDPRRRIAACAGKPACGSGFIDARAIAAEMANHLPGDAADLTLHISGCAKGCAHPEPAALTMVGSEQGIGIIRHGSARATPDCFLDRRDIISEVVRMSGVGHG